MIEDGRLDPLGGGAATVDQFLLAAHQFDLGAELVVEIVDQVSVDRGATLGADEVATERSLAQWRQKFSGRRRRAF